MRKKIFAIAVLAVIMFGTFCAAVAPVTVVSAKPVDKFDKGNPPGGSVTPRGDPIGGGPGSGGD